jgi:hypothetical protein
MFIVIWLAKLCLVALAISSAAQK